MIARVLIVEDDETIRETMKLALELHGYEVFTAANGREGIDTLVGMPRPCLILLDLMMPVMDGWRFMEALEGEPVLETIPIVIVTAFGSQLGKTRARCVMSKPVALETLYSTVGQYCSGSAVARA
jgi:CheY-like chemotaxis protein